MKKYIEVRPEETGVKAFSDFKEGVLVLAGDEKQSNALMVTNAMFGRMWDKDVIMVAIKPLRYTKEFIDINESFSVNFFSPEYQKEKEYIGSVTGREVNKMSKSSLERNIYRGTPYFSDAETVFFCKKLFSEEIKETSFIDKTLIFKHYLFKDFHSFYIAEITKVFKQEFEY